MNLAVLRCIRRRLIAITVYELPWRKGGSLGSRIVGDWGVSVIAEVRDGAPFGISEPVNTSITFSSGSRSKVSGASALMIGSMGKVLRSERVHGCAGWGVRELAAVAVELKVPDGLLEFTKSA